LGLITYFNNFTVLGNRMNIPELEKELQALEDKADNDQASIDKSILSFVLEVAKDLSESRAHVSRTDFDYGRCEKRRTVAIWTEQGTVTIEHIIRKPPGNDRIY